MICPVCEQETRCVCLCGYCPDCIERYTHDGCTKIVKENKEKLNKLKEDWKTEHESSNESV